MWKIGKLFKRKPKETGAIEARPDVISEDVLSSRNLARIAYENIERLASQEGGRPAGSRESRRMASLIASMYEELGLEAKLNEFHVLKDLGKVWPRVAVVSMFLSILLMLVGLPYIALLVLVLSGVFCYFDGVVGRDLFPFLRKKGKGANVEVVLEPKGEVSQTIVFSAHHDSAPLFRNPGYRKDVIYFMAIMVVLLVLSLGFSFWEIASGCFFRPGITGILGWILLVIATALAVPAVKIWNLYSDRFSPGVGDNLSGEGVNLALARYFTNRNLKTTRLVFTSFDSEETGHQGARDYFASTDLPLDTEILNIDGLYEKDELCFLSLDGNGSVKLSDYLSSELVHLGKVLGYSYKTGKLPFLGGSTDAMEAARKGYRATTLTSMHPDATTPAHTEDDTIEAIDKETLESVIQLMIRHVTDLDDRNSGDKTEEEKSFIDPDRRYKLSIYDED